MFVKLKRFFLCPYISELDSNGITATFSQGVLLVKENRVLKGPLGRSLCSFARTAHSARSLRSLPRGTVEILEYVFTL